MTRGRKQSKLNVYSGPWWMDSTNKTTAKKIAARQRRGESKKVIQSYYKD